jgi:hypothetical protein
MMAPASSKPSPIEIGFSRTLEAPNWSFESSSVLDAVTGPTHSPWTIFES